MALVGIIPVGVRFTAISMAATLTGGLVQPEVEGVGLLVDKYLHSGRPFEAALRFSPRPNLFEFT
jgi:hypothetical protein